jgi:hypothetical protein
MFVSLVILQKFKNVRKEDTFLMFSFNSIHEQQWRKCSLLIQSVSIDGNDLNWYNDG